MVSDVLTESEVVQGNLSIGTRTAGVHGRPARGSGVLRRWQPNGPRMGQMSR